MTRPIFKVSQQLTFSLVALGCGLAWWLRFVQDDAFISFVYARNLVEGEGLLWFGQKVEGYTNFAWVLWIALGLRLGVDPVPWSQISGIAAFAAAIIGLAGLGRHVFENRWVGLLAALLFVTNFSAVSYATGGLETMLQTSLLCLATLQTELLDRQAWRTRQQLKTALFEYIEVFYHRRRRHSTLGYLSPLDFERRWTMANPTERHHPAA